MEFPLYPNDDDDRERAEEDAKHLRAVKILDAYSQTHRGAPRSHYDREKRMWFIEILSNGCCVRTVGRRSAAAARMLAADALVKEDPSLLEEI